MHQLRALLVALFVWSALAPARARADEVSVAVASSFTGTLDKLARAFRERTGHTIVASSASSGQLHAQITAGAPFDVFLSADVTRPEALERAGLVAQGSRFVYARGRLVLWSARGCAAQPCSAAMLLATHGVIALADPRSAPYGAAAQALLRASGMWDALERTGRLSIAGSVAQAYQFVANGAAEAGFVALSQVLASSGKAGGGYWAVPDDQGGAIDQAAVLLRRAERNAAGRAFLEFLRSEPRAAEILSGDGYEPGTPVR